MFDFVIPWTHGVSQVGILEWVTISFYTVFLKIIYFWLHLFLWYAVAPGLLSSCGLWALVAGCHVAS